MIVFHIDVVIVKYVSQQQSIHIINKYVYNVNKLIIYLLMMVDVIADVMMDIMVIMIQNNVIDV